MIYGHREVRVIGPVHAWLTASAHDAALTPDGLASILLARALSDQHEVACAVQMIARLGFYGTLEAPVRVPVRVHVWVRDTAAAHHLAPGSLASLLLARALSNTAEVRQAVAMVKCLGLEGALGFEPGSMAGTVS